MLAAIIDIPPNVGYAAVFALIAVETMGIPVPGETALIAAALLAHDGRMDIVLLCVVASAAAIIGDNVGFAIGRKGDLVSKVRESLVSIGRVVTFLSAVVEGAKWSKDMREQLKTMQRDVGSLTDHASYLSSKITFTLDAMLGEMTTMRAGFVEHRTTLWRTYESLAKTGAPIAMRKVNHRRDIYPVFRELFGRKDARAEAEA